MHRRVHLATTLRKLHAFCELFKLIVDNYANELAFVHLTWHVIAPLGGTRAVDPTRDYERRQCLLIFELNVRQISQLSGLLKTDKKK